MRVRSLAHSALSFLVVAPLTLASARATTTTNPKKLAADDNPDDPTGKTLYITEPACGSYRCIVTWPVGSSVAVNWLGPPAGNVSVSLASNIGGPEYVITPSIPATSQEGYCDSGYGLGVVAHGHECGRVEFVVPEDWKQMNNYTIIVQSLEDSTLVGYTDMITVAPYNASSPSAVPSANIPSGTSASLLTIADPTSTNKGASTKYTGNIPAPTAVTGGAGAAPPLSSAAPPPSSRADSIAAAGSSTFASVAGQTSLASTSSSAPSSASAAAASASQTGAAPSGPGFARGVAAMAVAALGLALVA
ncbi:hypothetical protein JCM3770_007432 [Rhodotorula araucariae]